eukprot:superscaffoldBa00002402_g14132
MQRGEPSFLPLRFIENIILNVFPGDEGLQEVPLMHRVLKCLHTMYEGVTEAHHWVEFEELKPPYQSNSPSPSIALTRRVAPSQSFTWAGSLSLTPLSTRGKGLSAKPGVEPEGEGGGGGFKVRIVYGVILRAPLHSPGTEHFPSLGLISSQRKYLLQWYCWEDEEEGGAAASDTPGKGTVSQGTAGPLRRRQDSHNLMSASRTEAQPQGAASPAHHSHPSHSNTTHLPTTTPTGSGLLSHPWATYIPLSLSQSPCPTSTVT